MKYIDRMKGQDFIDRSREYLDYLEEHLNNVRQAFVEISDACAGMFWVSDDYQWHSFREEVMQHDLSKFSSYEFTQYRRKFFPVDQYDAANKDFDDAFNHHKQVNTHHHETVETYIDIVHMVIDWTAMGYKYNDTAEEYYTRNKSKIKLSTEHERFLEEIFKCIRLYEIKNDGQ